MKKIKTHFKNYYAVYLAGILGLMFLTVFTSLIFSGFYVVASVFLPQHEPITAGLALMFLFACACFMFADILKK